MIHKMFTVYDAAAKAFLRPFFTPTEATAIRAFTQEVNTPKTPLNNNPEDFSLFYLGEYDDANGSFDLLKTPNKTRVGLEVLNREDRPDATQVSDETPVQPSAASGDSAKQLRQKPRA
jgi:hypothetical protein